MLITILGINLLLFGVGAKYKVLSWYQRNHPKGWPHWPCYLCVGFWLSEAQAVLYWAALDYSFWESLLCGAGAAGLTWVLSVYVMKKLEIDLW